MEGARTIRLGENGYPPALARIAGAPEQLRVRGDLGPSGMRRVAVVGTRRPSSYGVEVATRLAGDLARAGVSIVSGGAEGIDTAAHQAALSAGGQTIAVFGCGLDVVFPAANRELFERIAAGGGALVSEYDDGFPAARYTFPRRNRIISGLSDAVIVVQAGERSGALITADWASRQAVPIFAVPGEVGHPLSVGPLALLRKGARLATCAGDVLDALGIQLSLPLDAAEPPREAVAGLSAPAAAVFGVLSRTPLHADEVARAAGLQPGNALSALLDLELRGLCEQRPGQYFVRRG